MPVQIGAKPESSLAGFLAFQHRYLNAALSQKAGATDTDHPADDDQDVGFWCPRGG